MSINAMKYTLPLLLAACCLVGCSNGVPTYSVTGTVRVNGKPAPHGTVMFRPVEVSKEDGKRHVARASIEKDGTYTLTTIETGDGAVAGMHKVAVLMPPYSASETGPQAKPLIPAKFNTPNTSGLEYEVKPGSNEIDIELNW